MKKRNYFKFALLSMLSMLIFSCSKTENGDVEYIPFQETDDGQWGMISMDGKVLFKDEFKNKPTIVRDGRFFALTSEGFWEMYEAAEKPRKIGPDYAHISGFHNGRALVAEKNKPVAIIDTDGNTIKLLDKIDNKEVDGVRVYKDNYAVFMTTDSLWGVIDGNGNCVVKPEYYSLNDYGDGKFIGINNKYKKNVKLDKKDKITVSVINTNGKVIFDFNADKYENIQNQFIDGKIAISVKKDGKEIWGIINDKGETLVKPSSKLKSIGIIKGDVFTYNNGDGWGLMNIKGETLIRAKYEELYYDEDNILVAVVKNGDSYEYKYIDEKDNQIGDETYVSATLFSMFDGKYAWVKPNDKIYSLIDKNCKQVEGLPDIVNVGTYEGEKYVKSDYVNLEEVFASLNISLNGVLNFTFKSTPKEVVKKALDSGSLNGTEEHPAGSAYWFEDKNSVNVYTNSYYNGLVTVHFKDYLSRQTYSTQRVIDYVFGDYYWFHDNNIPTGYTWNETIPDMFSIAIGNAGKMHGKLLDVYNFAAKIFKEFGTIAKQNDNAMVLTLKNGMKALIGRDENYVYISWGYLKPVKELDISRYEGIEEEYDLGNISYEYLNDLFPDMNYTSVITDSIE